MIDDTFAALKLSCSDWSRTVVEGKLLSINLKGKLS